ncbi:LYR motif-containing protein 4B-like [Paramacrobiotus metropolitanus]|uniref:LYR motif-containing protein 4B-like n=1 Tax=Paramacrobiotus metropolitanus TaxID=2943436 RepID=UPI0024457CF7|nr:LYR motif-containing protein 4B-like [Paramacrobiotus metropolitanus]
MTREALALYKQLIRASNGFSNYNYRCYAIRRVQEEFKRSLHEKDPRKISQMFSKAQTNLEIIKRQATLSQLYPSNRLVIETLGKLPEAPKSATVRTA